VTTDPVPEEGRGSTAAPAVVYPFRGSLYINLTNRCPTACIFCTKSSAEYRFYGRNLRLQREPSPEEILRAVADPLPYREIIFCGYGEPTYRLAALCEVSRGFMARGCRRIRLNTIGLGNLIHGRDIVPALKGCVDAVSVSLNTADPEQWRHMHRPRPAFSAEGFSSALAFVAGCVAASLDTTVTAIDFPWVNLEAVRTLAGSLGAQFRVRPPLDPAEQGLETGEPG
jgi:TatD family-associated radical SAM protein